MSTKMTETVDENKEMKADSIDKSQKPAKDGVSDFSEKNENPNESERSKKIQKILNVRAKKKKHHFPDDDDIPYDGSFDYNNDDFDEDSYFEAQIRIKSGDEITEFDLEWLFYKRNDLYWMNGELYAYKENCNYLEMLTDKNLETRILESLESELIKVGKVSMVKSIVKLIRMRPAKHFTVLSEESKMIAFMDVVLAVDNWNVHDAIDAFGGTILVNRPSNCTYQIKIHLDKRVIPPFRSSSSSAASNNPAFAYLDSTQALFSNTRPSNYISPNSPWPVKGQEVSEIEIKRQQYLANLANSISTPVADKFFNEIADGKNEIIQRIYEVIGYILVPDNTAKAFFLFQGESNSGKSVLGKFLEGYFDKENVTSLDIYRLGGKYLPEALSTSRLNLSMDLPDGKLTSASVAVLKMLTGDDLITHEVKYKDAKPYRGQCKLVFSTNFPLVMKVYDPALLNRLICIPFTHSISKKDQNPNLLAELEEERMDITTKALACYYLLRSRGYRFKGEDIVKPKIIYQIDPYDTIRTFVEEKCHFTDDNKSFVSTEDLYNAYTEFCLKEGLNTINTKSGFSQRFIHLYSNKVNSTDRRIGDKHVNGYAKIAVLKDVVEWFDKPQK